MSDERPPLVVSAVNTRVRFEQWAKNPTCDANTVSAVLNVPMGHVAKTLGFEDKKQLPPFAIARGLSFEKYLFEDDAKKIKDAMKYQKMFSVEPSEVEFFDYRHQGNLQGLSRSAERSAELSKDFLYSLAKSTANTKTKIVSGLTIKLAKGVMLPEATLMLDCLLATPIEENGKQKWHLKVGEIKIFPDRGGYTDPNQISSARAQAGVYKHALDQWILENHALHAFTIDDFGFLVFTWPGSTFPVVRPNEDLRSQAERARAGFERMDEIGQRVIEPDRDNYDGERYLEWVAHSKTNFREACWEFCDLAERCQDEALKNRRGIFLGTDAARLLGTVTIERAIELINTGDAKTEFEESLMLRLLDAKEGLF